MSLGWAILLRISLAGSPHNKLVLLTKEEEALDPVEIASLETVSFKVLTLWTHPKTPASTQLK